MSFTYQRYYSRAHEFSNQELLSIKPIDIVHWLCLKAYGTPNPEEDANPTEEGRASSLAFIQKALSYFMPNSMPWNPETESGNPAKSNEVRRLVKSVQKKEVRGLGMVDRRP